MANLHFEETPTEFCPDGFGERSNSSSRICGIASPTAACPDVVFDTFDIPYSSVCGRVLAYRFGTTEAFGGRGSTRTVSIDSNYVDGVSLTRGDTPREHVWTFAAGHTSDPLIPTSSCRCVEPGNLDIPFPPPFVRKDYFCDVGSHNVSGFTDGPLWDGLGCNEGDTCCSFNRPPWFHKRLPFVTTENLEMRVCSDEGRDDEDIALSLVELYIQ